jgi:hypothetical protein
MEPATEANPSCGQSRPNKALTVAEAADLIEVLGAADVCVTIGDLGQTLAVLKRGCGTRRTGRYGSSGVAGALCRRERRRRRVGDAS